MMRSRSASGPPEVAMQPCATMVQRAAGAVDDAVAGAQRTGIEPEDARRTAR